jgi:hypothetical protein
MTPIDHTLEKLRTVRLPEEVRTRMRAELSAYADLHEYTPVPVVSPFHTLRMRLYTGLTAVLLFTVTLGGTAFAAEDALPGSPLYAVKLRVTEPIQTALVPSIEGKAAWHAILAERRLEEAALLAAREELSPEVTEDLAENLEAHVDASVAASTVVESQGDVVTALALRSDLEARLTAHTQILTVMADHYAATDQEGEIPTTLALASLVEEVEEHTEVATTARLALEDAILPDAPVAATTIALSTGPAEPAAKVAPSAANDPEPALMAAMAPIDQAEALRAQEVEDILTRNAGLLAKFLPTASTTASTTTAASTTPATTTPPTLPEASQSPENPRKPF